MFETLRQNSAYRSVRYSTIRKDSHTADNSARLSQFRVKRKPYEESTFYKTRTIELKPQTVTHNFYNNPEQYSYNDTFQSLLQSQKRVKNIDESLVNHELKIKFTNFDKNFVKEDGTEFTLLDPFHRPYSYLTAELSKQQKELSSQKEELRMIKAQLHTAKRNTLSNLREIEQQGKKEMNRLRNAIKKNDVQSQQTRMRVRRQLTELFYNHDTNINLNHHLHHRSSNIQKHIFSCEPFELEVE